MKDVSWRRGGKDILHHIHWQVHKGEHWAVLGLNGSGKTTLLNMVNGYTWPTTGEVIVLGETFGKTDIYTLRKRIGWVSSSLGERINGRHKAEDLVRSEEHTSELQSRVNLVCRLLLEKKNKNRSSLPCIKNSGTQNIGTST